MCYLVKMGRRKVKQGKRTSRQGSITGRGGQVETEGKRVEAAVMLSGEASRADGIVEPRSEGTSRAGRAEDQQGDSGLEKLEQSQAGKGHRG